MYHVEPSTQSAIKKILSSYDTLTNMNYKQTKLGTVTALWDVINVTMHDLITNIESSTVDNDTTLDVLTHSKRYLQGYDFSQELGRIADLYEYDLQRVRSIALKISESLYEKGLITLFRDVDNA